MRDERVSMERDAVESMQRNLNRGEPAIVASYGLIGAIMLLGGAGSAADRYLGTGPWCLLAGLIAGLANRILSARPRPPPLTATSVRRAMSCHDDAGRSVTCVPDAPGSAALAPPSASPLRRASRFG